MQIFSNFVIKTKKKQLHQSDTDNFFAKFGKILDVCKHFSKDLVIVHGNMSRRGVAPKFSDLEVIALSLTTETESIDSKPIGVCRLSRRKRCKMGEATPDMAPNFGYCASQGAYYFGYKLHDLHLSESVQLDLFESANIRLECPYRLNPKAWKPTFIPFAKARKRVETVFSQLCDPYMVIRNYAKQTDGLNRNSMRFIALTPNIIPQLNPPGGKK